MTALLGLALVSGLLVAPDEEAGFRSELAALQLPRPGLAALDGHLAFERALRSLVEPGGLPAERADALAELLQQTSPFSVPRSFSDGREPTGWDWVQRREQAALAARRPELAPLLSRVEQQLSPDVWKVREGLGTLGELVLQAADEPAVAGLVARTAERLAPFAQYHDGLWPVIDAARESRPGSHTLQWAAVRLACAPGPRGAAPVPPPWEVAIDTAPTAFDAELGRLMALSLELGAPDRREEALDELSLLASSSPHPELSRRALELALRHEPSLDRALSQVSELRRSGVEPERVAAGLLVLARDRATALTAAQPDVLRRFTLLLDDTLATLGDSPDATCLHWSQAVVSEAAGDAERRHAELLVAAAPALDGDTPAEAERPVSEWWLPLGDPLAKQLRPVEYSRAACWTLADDAWRAQRWDEVLRFGALPPAAEGCGNVVASAERWAARRRADAFTGLGRHVEAVAVRRGLLLDASWNDVLTAAEELVDAALAADAAPALEAWLSAQSHALVESDRGELTAAWLRFARALQRGERGPIEREAGALLARWPDDADLARLVEARLSGER